ncbi:hypothetical protein LEP1GSC073_3888 [Leptospira noguchii str. Cascata]|nr:hypothetical protein LEP1GSC072_3701 [Leptospira noguchii str. Bonito]EMS88607.1 hypothetical protein LEP1GSC073_3888 [Leptospira noguchii str. Cascata]
MAHDRAFRSNSFGISATIAFAFVMPNSRYLNVNSKQGIHFSEKGWNLNFIDQFLKCGNSYKKVNVLKFVMGLNLWELPQIAILRTNS